MNFSLCKSQIE